MSMVADTILPRSDDSALRRWAIAAFVVLLAHIGLVVLFVLAPPSGMPPGNPPDTVMINLAPIAVAPPPQQEVVTPPQPQEVQPQTPPQPTPLEQQPPQPQQMTDMPVEPDVLPAPQPEVMMAPPPPKVEKKEKAKHEVKKPPARAQPNTNLPRAQKAATTRGANGAAASSWKSEIVMRIESVKEYPAGAQAQGTAVVAFSVDRSGRVSGVRLARSSGSAVLDRAAVGTVQRANPVPAPPPGVPGGYFSVPLHFSLLK